MQELVDYDMRRNHRRWVTGWRETGLNLQRKFFPGAATQAASVNHRRPQAQLPKLPVPELEQTMSRYLDNLKPIVSKNMYEETQAMVRQFVDLSGPGPKIQDELLVRRDLTENWAYEWWLTDMYLSQPLCLPININPGMVFPLRQFRGFSDIARYAARLISSACKYKDMLDRGELEQEMVGKKEKGEALCMTQYYRLFTSYRMPGFQQDTLISSEPEGIPITNHRYVILACRNKFYRLDVRQCSVDLSEEDIASHVLHVLQSGASVNQPPPPVGLLTSQRRDLWAEHRQFLLQYETNAECLDWLEKCMMVVCLDLSPPEGSALQRDDVSLMHQMLHGGGSHLNTANRWFDKTIQIIISSDGASGLCYEHSPSEGIAVIAVLEKMLESCSDLKLLDDDPLNPCSTNIQQLQWVEPPGLGKIINEAARSIDNLIEDVDFRVLRFQVYGKSYIKSCNISPDVYIQLALQLAYYRLHGKLVATYESAGTRRFQLGRVDCIRSATWEALQWVSAMVEPSSAEGRKVSFSLKSDEEKIRLFREAVAKQTEVMTQNIRGQGIDVHLLGLREQAKIMELPLDLFNSQAYQIANYFGLSTSQVTTKWGFMGYGAVVPDGYGVSYNIADNCVLFCIGSFYSAAQTGSTRMSGAIEESLQIIQQLLAKEIRQS